MTMSPCSSSNAKKDFMLSATMIEKLNEQINMEVLLLKFIPTNERMV